MSSLRESPTRLVTQLSIPAKAINEGVNADWPKGSICQPCFTRNVSPKNRFKTSTCPTCICLSWAAWVVMASSCMIHPPPTISTCPAVTSPRKTSASPSPAPPLSQPSRKLDSDHMNLRFGSASRACVTEERIELTSAPR